MRAEVAAQQSALFRFDSYNHEYLDPITGEVFPHITGMLEETGWIDDLWFTEESSERGHQVHRLTADYDLGAIEDPASVASGYKGYLAAHVKAIQVVRPEILAVEQPIVHPVYRFGGRPDRDVIAYGLRGVWEVKSGEPARSHQIQTALQAILVAIDAQLPPEQLARFCCYVKRDGKFKLEEHKDRRDFDEARRIIRRICGR